MSQRIAARSYRPGQWFGVLGDRTTVLLPPTERDRAIALWSLVDDGAGFEELLDALVTGGLADLPSFVLLTTTGDQTRALVRGSARACFETDEGRVELDGRDAGVWAERSLVGVTRLVVDVEDDGPAEPDWLPIHGGLVRVSSVAEPAEETESVGEPADPDQTDEVPRTPAPPVSDHDGLTRTGWPVADEPTPPGIPGQPPAPAVVSRPVARLVFSSGETVDVDRPVLVGRAPEARRFGGGDQPRLVRVPSPAQEISSTHLEIRPGSGADHGTAVVTDLGSTNGTVLVQPGLPPEDLRAGIAVQLIPGAVVDLGDGVTIRVINA